MDTRTPVPTFNTLILTVVRPFQSFLAFLERPDLI